PNGRGFASSSGDGSVRVGDVTTGALTHTLPRYANVIGNVTFSPDSERLATVGVNGKTVELWDLQTGKVILTLRGHRHYIWEVAFSHDGQRLASSSLDGTVKVWDAVSSHEALLLRGQHKVGRVAFSPDGRSLASVDGVDRTVNVWDVETGQVLRTLPVDTAGLSDLTLSPDGRLLAAAGEDGTVLIREVLTGEVR